MYTMYMTGLINGLYLFSFITFYSFHSLGRTDMLSPTALHLVYIFLTAMVPYIAIYIFIRKVYYQFFVLES